MCFNSKDMNFEILHQFPSPDLERAWREFLTRVEVVSHYDSPEFFLDPLHTRPFAVLAIEDNRVWGSLTGSHTDNAVVSGLPSRPQICVDSSHKTATLETLSQGLLAEAADAKLVIVYSWSSLELDPFSAQGFRRRQL